jgi:eukaryotic-like serine/threonine-protein kinase
MGALVESVAKRAQARVGSWACDKWQLERLIGVGGVAAVYAARHKNGRRVAIKMLHPELAVDASIRRRFLREGYAANRVEHSGAVVVLDDAIEGDSVFLVMELLEGETLEARCRRNEGKIEPGEALRIASGLLSILQSAHDHGILHRDVTPANIFVTRKGEVKLLDFGIARLRDADSGEHTVSVPGALGTPAFMAPEQARGLWEELDARSDLWAVGAVMFRALTGRSVHQGRSPSEQLLSAMTRRAPPLESVMPDIYPAIASVVDRAMEVAPAKRWPDAQSFRVAVDEVYAELAGHEIAEAEPLTVPSELAYPGEPTDATHADGFGTTVGTPTRRSRRWIFAVAAAGIVVLVGIGYAESRSSRAGSPPPVPVSEVAPPPATTAAAKKDSPARPQPATKTEDTPPAKKSPTVVLRTKMKASEKTTLPRVEKPKPDPRTPALAPDNPLFDNRN